MQRKAISIKFPPLSIQQVKKILKIQFLKYNTFYVFLRLELKIFEKLIARSESRKNHLGIIFFRYILALQTLAENSMIWRSRAAPGELTRNASYIRYSNSRSCLYLYLIASVTQSYVKSLDIIRSIDSITAYHISSHFPSRHSSRHAGVIFKPSTGHGRDGRIQARYAAQDRPSTGILKSMFHQCFLQYITHLGSKSKECRRSHVN